jgi:ABC-2 type transport system permease protein
MNNILNITSKDLLLFTKDLGRLFMTFLLPLVFILAFGFAYSQLSGGVQLVDLVVVNLDVGGEMSSALIASLGPSRGVKVTLYAQAEADRMLEEGEIQRVLVIPAGFTQAVQAGEKTTLRLVNGPEANESDTDAMYTVIDGVAKDLSLQTQLIAAFQQMDQMMMAGGPGFEMTFSGDLVVTQAQSQFERARTAPLVGVEEKLPDAILKEQEEIGAMDIAVPGFTVLFVFLTAGTTALAIYSEKKLGTFRRLLAAPLSRFALLIGKMVPNVIIVLLQVIVIFAVGVWVMPLLGMDQISLGNLLALAVVSLLVALTSTSLGVFIAALARTESQISGVAAVVLWVAGAVAGAFIPQFAMGDFLRAVGSATPHYWAISAYTDVMVRSKSLADVGTQLGILALFTVGFFAVGLWRFRFDA